MIIRLNQQCSLLVGDDMRNSTRSGRHNRNSGSHALEQRPRHAVDIRGGYVYVCAVVQLWDARWGDFPDELIVAKLKRRRIIAKMRFGRSDVRNCQFGVGVTLLHNLESAQYAFNVI